MSEVALIDNQDGLFFLEDDAAIELWLKGKIAWNDWVAENQFADVSFSDVDFSQYRNEKNGQIISFDGYDFPIGRVDFSLTKFGDGPVLFSNVDFNEGKVDFSFSRFGKGRISFVKARFGKGNRDFSVIEFHEGAISFKDAVFEDGDIDFSQSSMGNGVFNFSGVVCGEGSVNFSGFEFGKGTIVFLRTDFVNGDVVFNDVDFSDGDVIFKLASFGEGFIDFRHAKFGKGVVDFRNSGFYSHNVVFDYVNFGTGVVDFTKAHLFSDNVSFEKITFSDVAIFKDVEICKETKSLSFKHSQFDKSFDISCGKINCIPDLTSTKVSNQVILSDFNYSFNREGQWYKKKAVDEKDSARLRRLKEIAENNKDHAAALRFHADEMRAKRWHEMGFGTSVLDMFFSGLSNYGQSIARPFVALCTLMFAMALYAVGFVFPLSLSFKDYSQWLTNTLSIEFPTWLNGFDLAISSALPFISSSRNVHKQAEEALQGILPDYFGAISLVYGGLCFLFLFLIGLGLRNRFRI